jgi:hypothetical protein
MPRMKPFTTFIALLVGTAFLVAAESKDTRIYETRIYYAHPGKLDDLHKRFRDHTTKLFEKHGIENIGYWTPIDNPSNVLFYIVAHKSMEASGRSWKAFGADPDWKKAAKESEAAGPIVKKIERYFMRVTDYSPAIKPEKSSTARVFEWRDYIPSEGNLANLDARFRDHTIKLFTKHGMENFGYWHTEPDKQGKQRLVYLLAHKSKEAGAASFDAFRKDPVWIAAKKASEEKAGGSLTASNGVVSLFMVPTDYSPTK